MKYYRAIPYLILLCISIAFSGCFSSHIERSEVSKLDAYYADAPQYYKILYAHMKDSSIVDLLNMNARYMKEYKGVKNIIVYNTGKGKEEYIQIKDISYVVIERSVLNAGQTVLTVGLIIIAAAAILFLLYLNGFSNMH
jgi:hypothetical protein